MTEPSLSSKSPPPVRGGTPSEVFLAFLKLGLTSFGGPIAHLGYFRDELVVRRKWTDEAGYADLVALCQFLPGPASSQVGFALGLLRGGPLGALAAWAAFTLPSALLLIAFAFAATAFDGPVGLGLLHGFCGGLFVGIAFGAKFLDQLFAIAAANGLHRGCFLFDTGLLRRL
ncbi:MAG: chromate transporter, partial [Pseudorhizobium sp.]